MKCRTRHLHAAGALVLGLGVLGCKDQQKCDDALRTARQAMQDEYLDMALARQWREYAGKACGTGETLQTLDREILEREAALSQQAVAAAQAAEAAGRTAIEQSKQLWKDFDSLPAKEKTKQELKSAHSKAKKLVIGLTEDYAKQVREYSDKQYERRAKAFEK